MADTNELSVDERLSAMQAEYQRTTGALSAASKQVSDYTAMMRQQEGYMAALREKKSNQSWPDNHRGGHSVSASHRLSLFGCRAFSCCNPTVPQWGM